MKSICLSLRCFPGKGNKENGLSFSNATNVRSQDNGLEVKITVNFNRSVWVALIVSFSFLALDLISQQQ